VTVGNLSGDIICTPSSGCGQGDAQTLAVTPLPSGIGQQMDDDDIKIYPNPITTQVNVEINDMDRSSVIRIIDIRGNTVVQSVGQSSGGRCSKSFDLSGYARGIYYIHIINKQKSFVERVVVQ
ncbi:MAG: T9SS type A sorting domain-containing protein, partial [Salinivirgaceae bacterium]|nr:T9SS type A sorting domain-containing protein [Salinivirgaceae bacterium]